MLGEPRATTWIAVSLPSPIGCVDLVEPVAGDPGVKVTGDRKERDGGNGRVDADDDDYVGTSRAFFVYLI